MIRRVLPIVTAALAVQLSLAAGAVPLRPYAANPGDDEMVEMNRAIPGFGGLFYDADGYPNVYLTDPEAKVAVGQLKSLGDVRILRGDFEFARLVEWRKSLRPALGQPGVVFLDVDEARNRVVIGVDATRKALIDRARLEKAVADRGIPGEAVVIQEVAPLREIGLDEVTEVQIPKRRAASANLQGVVRPVPGGVQIYWTGHLCTVSFNAFLGSDFGFVTNSHCSDRRGEVDGTLYSQSLPGDGPIASEIADPEYAVGGDCPAGRKCRFSDSAFARYDSSKTGALAKVAKTSSKGRTTGSLTIKPAAARFTVKSKGGAAAGQLVNKVGRSSGWTYGTITNTCVDVSSSATEFTLFCQHIVQAGSDGGDSGSPVFSVTKGSNVKLLGILWAGGSGSDGPIFAFSPIESVEGELGALRSY
ncbi:MAG: hypothetical protein ACJ75H_18495 [Thermoanaerobaculia bacterium]